MPERLERFLRLHHPDRTHLRVVSYRVMAGGYSRSMARADIEWIAGDPTSADVLVLRGDPPPGTALLETDRAAEWELLSFLTAHGGVPMPAARAFDATGEHLGTKAIVLELAHGPTLQALLGSEPTADRQALSQRLADLAGQVHRIPVDDLPATLARPASWDAYLDAKIAVWKESELVNGEREPFVRYMGAWLAAHRPPAMPLTLCHGDFQNSNILVHPDGTLQLIDWEFAHIGDPREDLGWYKAYSSAAPPDLTEVDLAAFCDRYCAATGASPEAVNPVTLGYFTILGAIQIFANIMQMTTWWVTDGGAGVQIPYNVNSMAFGHKVWLEVSSALEQAMAAVEEAS